MASGLEFTANILTPPSINGERSRWVLDYYSLPYKEKRKTLAPLSIVPALRYKGKATGSAYVYVVSKHDGAVFRDPQKLAEYLDPQFEEGIRLLVQLDPDTEEAFAAAQSLFTEHIRPWSYSALTSNRRLFLQVMTSGVPLTQKVFMWNAYPVFKLLISRELPKGDTVQQNLTEAYDRSDSFLSDGREFVTGDRLTYSDIALAVNAAPSLMPSEYGGGGIFPSVETLPSKVRDEVESFRQRPTGQYVMNLFEKYRLQAAP